LVTSVGVAAVLACAAAVMWSPLSPGIGGYTGLAFWIAVVFLGAAAPVRMSGGAVVDVTIAPVLAATALGGPAAGAAVALLGTIELREIRGLAGRSGGIPWYGSVFNHSVLSISAIAAGWVLFALNPGGFVANAQTLVAVVVAGVTYFTIDNLLAAAAVATREVRPLGAVLVGNLRQFGVSLAGLAPLAWLMAAMYVVAGPIGILP
jgi:hypothetical protein